MELPVEMPELEASNNKSQATAFTTVVAIVVLGLFFMLLLYLGLTRYFNAQELSSLVEGAVANGQRFSVVIHNGLTGRYSFNVE